VIAAKPEPTPLAAGEVQEIRILRLAAGGDGVGRWGDGRAVFVPRTAPGDVVSVEAYRVHRRHLLGRPRRLVAPGPDRVSPRCAHYEADACGGCQFQHLGRSTQVKAKSAIVGDSLRRIGGLDCPDPEVVADGPAWGYRNKITLTRDRSSGHVGLHRWDHPDRIFDLVRCEILAPELIARWASLRLRRNAIPPDAERLVLRLDQHGGCHFVIQRHRPGPWHAARELALALESEGLPTTLWSHLKHGRVRQAAGPPGDRSATVFQQVNRTMGDRVRRDAIAAMGPVSGRHVWDLYAGAGDASRLLAGAGATIEAVESDRVAVDEGQRRCRGFSVRWHQGTVETRIAQLAPSDRVLLNPPRTGLARQALARLLERRPQRLVYISCDPATLARDLNRLAGSAAGYAVTSVRAYDLFPQTAHVETVAVVERP
jgi:23S rRNA (uracil1939-C5)-methyltransferase